MCANSVGFGSLDTNFTDQSRPNANGKFCAVADAFTTDVLAPTSSGPKTVSAYGISLTETMECLTFPAALTDTYGMLKQVGDPTRNAGSPWTPDAVQITRWAPASNVSGRVMPWPSIPVPSEGAVVSVQGSDARALLGAVQFPDTPGALPRYFRSGGLQAMSLPDGSIANIAFIVVLPGDDGIMQTS